VSGKENGVAGAYGKLNLGREKSELLHSTFHYILPLNFSTGSEIGTGFPMSTAIVVT
jgi:hypothetical protein